MKTLVEDAGGELGAGYVSRRCRLLGIRRGEMKLGGRLLCWSLEAGAVAVTHPPVPSGGRVVKYSVRLAYTDLPSGGDRPWWLCPACGGRVDSLYLPAGRDRLGCRRCCGLTYRSQYTRRRVRRRKQRPVSILFMERKQWTAATGWVVLARRERRL